MGDGKCGPHSLIDLLIGVELIKDKGDVDLELKATNGPVIGLAQATLGETKKGQYKPCKE